MKILVADVKEVNLFTYECVQTFCFTKCRKKALPLLIEFHKVVWGGAEPPQWNMIGFGT